MEIRSQADILAKPELIKELIEVIDFGDMPPENEQPLSEEQRTATILLLKDFMRQAAADAKREKPRLSRLNRFQYNNSLRDLFRIESDLFELSEKMMTRRTKYLQTSAETIPQVVRPPPIIVTRDSARSDLFQRICERPTALTTSPTS